MVEEWLTKHRPAMMALARRFEGRVSRADDIVQEASMLAVSLADASTEIVSPRRWLLAITRNVALRVVTKRERRTRLADVLLGNRPGWLGDDVIADWWQVDGATGPRERVVRAASKLPRVQRAVILSALLDNLEDAEIAARLGIAKSTVRVHRYHAIRALRSSIGVVDQKRPAD